MSDFNIKDENDTDQDVVGKYGLREHSINIAIDLFNSEENLIFINSKEEYERTFRDI